MILILLSNFVREGDQDSSNMSDGTSGSSIGINRNSDDSVRNHPRLPKGAYSFIWNPNKKIITVIIHQFLVLPKVIKILYLVYLISQLQGNVSKARHSYKLLQELIIEKARKGAIVRIIVWQRRAATAHIARG